MDFVAVGGVCGEHLAGDLSVAGLVCADEAKLVAAGPGGKAEEQEEGAEEDQDGELAGGTAEVGLAERNAGLGEGGGGESEAGRPRLVLAGAGSRFGLGEIGQSLRVSLLSGFRRG